MENDRTMIVSMVNGAKGLYHIDDKAGLLATFSDRCLGGQFAIIKLATGELPIPGQRNTLGTLSHQKLAIPFNDRHGNRLFFRAIH